MTVKTVNQLITNKHIIAVFLCFFIGFFSGLLGVGGGEFRLPVLIGILNLNIKLATISNLLIGVLVSVTSAIRRHSMMNLESYIIVIYISYF